MAWYRSQGQGGDQVPDGDGGRGGRWAGSGRPFLHLTHKHSGNGRWDAELGQLWQRIMQWVEDREAEGPEVPKVAGQDY